MNALDDLADRYVDEFAAVDPCLAAIMGIAGQDGRLTDYGPEGSAARVELARRTLGELARTPVEGDAGRVAAAVLRERLEVEVEVAESGVSEGFLDTTDGPVQRLRTAVELLDQGPATDWESVRARVAALPGALGGLRVSLRRACERGRVAGRRQVVRNARECLDTPAYLVELAGRYGDGPLRDGLDAAVRSASAALGEFAAFLTGELAWRAPERDALGEDRYTLGVRDFLGMELDLRETYVWGWEELARVKAEMAEAAGRVMPGEPLPAVVAALDADPAHRLKGADAFRGWIQELADRAIADLDGVHFDIPEPLRRIDCRIPPVESGIYYLAPAEDLSRPGTVWWTVDDPFGEIVTWSVPSTMFHEGAPGHHLQLGVTALNPGLNRYQRVASELHPGHCEGWGLYAERLMDELGLYRDPAHRLGMLAGGQQFRAARVILDIGMHLELEIPAGTGFHEGERWTPELGLEFLRAHRPGTDAEAAFEIDRYLGRPAQAIAYKLGEKVWLEAREAARRRDGAAFDLKGFHRRALDLGPMGLDALRAELAHS
ncbi:DUF885 domain-containing protein [Actinomadura spongiicola]|uniref:DUF885 domain-containing protein n=1 Tax=Actinomadura spongiicola TaxID=2303421 RepID=A0A372GET9_9ACTN|nr:DUF885 domain-containing protein [Actinomadura spongiicola]RFS83891.1 DUF885 domain-containing protein [Actinomadura spongiicola]